MPDVKAYPVSGAIALNGLEKGTSLLPLLAPGQYNLTLASTAMVTVEALTAGSIEHPTLSIGATLDVVGSNATATANYFWQQSANGAFEGEETLIGGATSASLATSSGVTAGHYVRRGVRDGVQGPVYTNVVQVSAAAAPGELHPDPGVDDASAWDGRAVTGGEAVITGSELVVTAATVSSRVQNVMNATYAIPVTAGFTQTMKVTLSEVTIGGNVQVGWRYYTDAAGNNQVSAHGGRITKVSTPTTLSETFTAPTGVAYMRLDLLFRDSVTLKISDISVTEA